MKNLLLKTFATKSIVILIIWRRCRTYNYKYNIFCYVVWCGRELKTRDCFTVNNLLILLHLWTLLHTCMFITITQILLHFQS